VRIGLHKTTILNIRSLLLLCLMIGGITLLSGCMYPKEQRQGQGVSYRESVDRIQRAMEQFQKEEGILPIITAGEETPRYEKFVIDLGRLYKDGYIDEIPLTAFEKGGSAYFLVIDEEKDPKVKVMDLVTVQKVNDVQALVNKFLASNDSQLPAVDGSETYPGLYTVDLEQIHGTDHSLRSVFSGETLPYLMDNYGTVFVDYAADIMQAINKAEVKPQAGEDLRTVLVDQSYFVPVKSLPYLWIHNDPIAQAQ
jgi:hypothetical protein